MTKSETNREAVMNYINSLTDLSSVDFKAASQAVVKETNMLYGIHNESCVKRGHWRPLEDMTTMQSAVLLHYVFRTKVVNLVYSDGVDSDAYSSDLSKDEYLIIGYYDAASGLYRIGEDMFNKELWEICPEYSAFDISEVYRKVKQISPEVTCTQNADLIPVNNGIFDYRNKVLLPFSPDFVFLTKCPVDFVPNAGNPVIHNDDDGTDWDVETWMDELSDDPEVVDLLWEILGAVIRPGVAWDKAAWLYSSCGNSGKGTLCHLMRNLCGFKNCTSIPISDFDGKQFSLDTLIGKSAVITDENDVGEYIDRSKTMKAVITGDPVRIERKYRPSIVYRFRGFMVQCLNGFPRVKDKSGSYARRQLIVPMLKNFNGVERKYIKGDYLSRKDVLEYVLHKILFSNYYELSHPRSCMMMLSEYQVMNNPVLEFCTDVFPELKWDLVPFTFLYDLFKAWFKENNPSGTLLSSKSFINEMLDVIGSDGFDSSGFICEDKNKRYRPCSKMDNPELLILKYGLSGWMNPSYKGNDPDKVCCPKLMDCYRGIVRA